MTTQKHLSNMIEQAAAIAPLVDMPPQVIGAAGITNAPGHIWWSTPFPLNQSQIHVVRFDKAELVYGRDILMQTNGQLVAYVAPLSEWPEMDIDDARAVLSAWHNLGKDEAAMYAEFIKQEVAQQT